MLSIHNNTVYDIIIKHSLEKRKKGYFSERF